MAKRVFELDLYVVVNEDGEYEAHIDGFDEARERYEESYDEDLPTERYHVTLRVPQPDFTKAITIDATVQEADKVREEIAEAEPVKTSFFRWGGGD